MSLGGRPPRGGQGGIDWDICEIVAADPSVAPGLARQIGWRVRKGDNSAAWDKTGTADTAWSTVGGGALSAGPGISILGGVVTNTAPFVGAAGKINAADKILTSGDSIIAGWSELLPVHPDPTFGLLVPLQRYITESFQHFGLSPPTFQNTAVSGQTSAAWLADLTAQVLTPITGGVKHVFLCIGANDAAAAVPPATTAANIVSGINQAHAVNPAVFFHVILNAFIFSDDPTTAFNLAMVATNQAISPAVLALPNVIVHDWQTAAFEWIARNNPTNQRGLLVQPANGTHPSKPTGQAIGSDCVFADLALQIPAFYRLNALGAQVPYAGTPWLQARALEASYIGAFTGRAHLLPERYSDISTGGGFNANASTTLEGGGIFGNTGARWLTSGALFQAPKTKAWGVAFRADLSLQAGASFAEVGILGAGAQIIRVRNDSALGVNLFAQLINGGTTSIDLGFQLTAGSHDICLYFTGAQPAESMPLNTLFVLVDGTVEATTNVLTNFPTAACAPYLQEAGTMHAQVSEFIPFWIRP